MNLQILIEQLNHEQAKNRLTAIHILGMVDEVRALDAISARVPIEMEAKVEKSLKEVGRTLNKLKREGFDTVDAICNHFNVYSEVLSYADEAEMKDIQRISNLATDSRADGNFNDKIINTASRLIAARVLGASAMMSAPSIDVSSNLVSVTESLKKQAKRVNPTTPSKNDFSKWFKGLKSDNPDERQEMLIQLNSNNNPAALPYMAHLYINDPEQRVRDTAKRLGRVLYWNTIYYEMVKDGSIEKIMQDFAASLGITLAETTSTQEIPAVVQESLEDILAKAEAQRKKRGRRI